MIIDDTAELKPDPLEIDPRPCEYCGLTINKHRRVDTPEGPEFYCDEAEMGGADIVRRWELADRRDRWKHTGEPPPPASVRNSDISAKPASAARPYRPPQSTIDAFWYVVSLCDPERLKTWLDDHPQDAPFLLKLLEGK